jgi:iron complex outermembrane recepter protein
MGMRSGLFAQLAMVLPILLMAQPVWAEDRLAEIGDQEQRAEPSQVTNHLSLEQNEEPVTHSPQSALPVVIPRLNELENAAITVEEWMTQLAQAAEVVQVTGVQLNSTPQGVEVILETAAGQLEIPATSIVGNALIADIPNAVLALPEGDEFSQANPIEGVALVSVTSLPNNRVRVAITGVDAPPIAEVRAEAQGLVFGVTPGTETDAAQDEDAIQVVVTGEQDEGYVVDNATTATRTDTPIQDVPQSIQVVPQQVIEDQRAITVNDALRNVSGVAVGESSLQFSNSILLRGFESFNSYFIDGVRNARGGVSTQLETVNVERIEVLKGPASVLYGQADPGGVINFVTELPLSEPYYAIEPTIGNFDFYRPTLDFSGPLNADRTVLYRLNAAYESAGTFVDDLDYERLFIAPTLSVQLGENTSLIFEGSYQNNPRPRYVGLPAVGTVVTNPLGDVPRSRNLGDPDVDDVNWSITNLGYRLEHNFSDNLTLRNTFRAEFAEIIESDAIFLTGLEPDNRTVNRFLSRSEGDTQNYTLQTDLVGTIQTGIVKQELLLGLELRRLTQEFEVLGASLPSIDLFDPDSELPSLQFEENYNAFQENGYVGVYAQDLISIGENLHILLGGRFDWVDQRYEGRLEGETTLVQGDTAFSPRAGIVYQPIPPVSLYASYSQSFFPEGDFGSRNADNTPFEPTTGEQFEVGVKTDFLDGRLSATLAAYQVTRQNIVTDDPDRPGFSIQLGERRSRGIEFDVIGEILPGWNLIANYAYTDAEITEDNGGFEGNQPNNVPEHSGSFWTTYEIQNGDLQGLGFGAGIFVVGDRQGDLANTFELPSYVRTDAALFYRRDNWQVALNVKNLFDVEYYESANNRNTVYPGAPFTILGTVAVEF